MGLSFPFRGSSLSVPDIVQSVNILHFHLRSFSLLSKHIYSHRLASLDFENIFLSPRRRLPAWR